MKRRKRMGLYKPSATPSRSSIEGPTRAHGVVETTPMQAHDPVQSTLESTPEKFVAFVNRMAAVERR